MLKRTLFFGSPYRLTLKYDQLVAEPKNGGEARTVPVEDIGFVVLDHMQLSISLPLVEALMKNNAAVIYCNSKHHPQAMLLNLESHNTQSEIFRAQLNAGQSLRKSLWKQTVSAKIINQANLLKIKGESYKDLLVIAKTVKSGDPENKEGTAARIYWKRLVDANFVRDRFGDYPNNLLNYGYIVLRAAVARALTGSGLLPALGIHHRNRYNAYCLADDIMEPYRPFLDRLVLDMMVKYPDDLILEKEHKGELLKVLTTDVCMKKTRRPLMLALSQSTASLAKCFGGERKTINYPVLE